MCVCVCGVTAYIYIFGMHVQVCVYYCIFQVLCFSLHTALGWGRIVNMASVHGLVASVNKSAYVCAKFGIVGLTKVGQVYMLTACLSQVEKMAGIVLNS